MKKYYYLICITCFLSTPEIQGQEEKTWGEWLRNKQFDQILSAADSLAAADSSNVQVMRAIGEAYEGFLDYKKAYPVYQYCLTLDTANIDLLSILGRTALSLGKVTDARHYFEQVLALDSSHFFAHYQLAQLSYQTGDYEESIVQLNTLRQQYPENATLEYDLGNSFMKLQKPVPAYLAYLQAFNPESSSMPTAADSFTIQ